MRYLLILIALVITSCSQNKIEVNLNHIKLIGSHNSYKQRIQKELWQVLYKEDSSRALTLDYGHVSLKEQLELGLRSLEIDVFYDPDGGRYKSPLGEKYMQELGAVPDDFDPNDKLLIQGLKVFHVQDIDYKSHCLLFKEALTRLKKWSNENKDHLPIIITINAKDQVIGIDGFTKPLRFNEVALSSIDKEILDVFEESQLILPDHIRKEGLSLESSVLKYGWPSLEESKGKFMFVLDEGGTKRDLYIKDHPSLENRVMFTTSSPGTPESAFLILNNPIAQLEDIKKWVAAGYLVRTRADAGTWEARKNDYSRWEAALESGAHIISTDYYLPDTIVNPNFQIKFKNGYEQIIQPKK